MKFIIDAHLPRRLSTALNNAGHDSIHTLDLPNANRTKDSEINALTLAEERVLISKDADFIESLLISNKPFKLLYIATGNITNTELQRLFERNMADIESALQQNRFAELTPTDLLVHQ